MGFRRHRHPYSEQTAELLKLLRVEHLASSDRLLGIFKRFGHPVVHAQVEVGKNEDWRLELLGKLEGFQSKFVALLHRSGQQDDVLGVAVRDACDKREVRLRGARG